MATGVIQMQLLALPVYLMPSKKLGAASSFWSQGASRPNTHLKASSRSAPANSGY